MSAKTSHTFDVVRIITQQKTITTGSKHALSICCSRLGNFISKLYIKNNLASVKYRSRSSSAGLSNVSRDRISPPYLLSQCRPMRLFDEIFTAKMWNVSVSVSVSASYCIPQCVRLIAGVCTHYVVYNISKKKSLVKVDPATHFSMSDRRSRGHTLKLEKPRARLELRRHFFSNRVIDAWNSLPGYMVEATSTNMFKAALQRLPHGAFTSWRQLPAPRGHLTT